ncbi:hypothetical protein I6E91_05795 [Enterocloster clostridioformis]|uniref:hypothetical protein n=1 Tax=Enterocloster clostridioformis TaxID=1531 RepID=UPI001F24F6EC|nr:hypothetical protein [Enterocloster clostridioformis]MCF2701659.1 hypothetical protein [Enterocloster clostridioformis]
MITVLTREYLATYVYLESEIKRIRRRIKYYEEHPVQQQYGVVKGSMQQFPFAECHFVVSGPTIKSNSEREKMVRQLIIDLKGNEQLFEDMKLDIETFLETLPAEDIEIKHILGLKYVERKSDGEIAKKLNYSRRTIGLKIDKFLNAIQKKKK